MSRVLYELEIVVTSSSVRECVYINPKHVTCVRPIDLRQQDDSVQWFHVSIREHETSKNFCFIHVAGVVQPFIAVGSVYDVANYVNLNYRVNQMAEG